MTLIVFMETLYIPESCNKFDEYVAVQADDEFHTLFVIMFFVVFIVQVNFLQALMAPEYVEALE